MHTFPPAISKSLSCIVFLAVILSSCTSGDSGAPTYTGRTGGVPSDCDSSAGTGSQATGSTGKVPANQLQAQGSSLTDCGQKSGEATPEGQAGKKDNPYANKQQYDDGVPGYDTANLESRFNRARLKKLKIPDEYKEAKIIAKSAEYYRAIWLDLRKQVWKGFDDFSARFTGSIENAIGDSQVTDYFFDVFKSPDVPAVKQVSVWQPLQTPKILDFDPASPLTFYLPGHVAIPKLALPSVKTLVFTPNPYLENNPAIAPPKDYELIYKKNGPHTADILEMCQRMNQELATGKVILPDIEEQTTCDAILPGTLMGSYNQMTGTYNNAFDELFKKQSVAVWKPIPVDGYKCLSHITTNGKQEKPFTEKDFAQSVVEIGVSERYAMYCVQEDLVVKGKLAIPPLVTDGEITIFKVISDDPDGYDAGNFFYAHKGQPVGEELQKIQVWVLNKKKAIILEDDQPLPEDFK